MPYLLYCSFYLICNLLIQQLDFFGRAGSSVLFLTYLELGWMLLSSSVVKINVNVC